MTNLLSRPAPVLARTVTRLSTVSGGRIVLGMGAGGLWEEIVALGVPRLSPAARVRALEEAIILVRALSGGGDPVTFEGEFYRVAGLVPAAAPTPPIWVGSLGPKALAVTGRGADGWIPGHLADWRSARVAESRPIVDEAAAAAGRNPAEVIERTGILDDVCQLRTRMRGMSVLDGDGNELSRSTEKTFSSGRRNGGDVELLREDARTALRAPPGHLHRDFQHGQLSRARQLATMAARR